VRSTPHDAFEDRAIPLDETQQLLIASALGIGEIVRLGVLGQAQQTIFLDRPLLGEDELILESPAINLALNFGKHFPRCDRLTEQAIHINFSRRIYLSHRLSSGMLTWVSDET
jgi:hypothetical protein